jgi:hypothetical protein
MKAALHPDDWLLHPGELKLLANRTAGNRLGEPCRDGMAT